MSSHWEYFGCLEYIVSHYQEQTIRMITEKLKHDSYNFSEIYNESTVVHCQISMFFSYFCRVLEGIRKSCLSTTQPLIQTSSQESKRQRLNSDGASKAVCPAESASFWKDIGHQASRVYQRLGVSLCRQSQLTDSLHFLRLSLQLDRGQSPIL